MTEQEAKKKLERTSVLWESAALTEIVEAVKLSINALEKQIAKKPRFYAHNYYCTECGNLVGNNEFKWQRFLFCDKCGTKIDWGDEDAD